VSDRFNFRIDDVVNKDVCDNFQNSYLSPLNTPSRLRPRRVWSESLNDFYDSRTDINQFGCVHNRSTTHALLKFMHEIFVVSDCSENIIRILFVDFHKAFDLIDHNILFNKLLSSGVPEHVIAWSLDFLNDCKQVVKIGDFVSAMTTVAAGTPHGTVSGPHDFKVIINDLTFNITYTKYVDDNCSICISGCKRQYTSI